MRPVLVLLAAAACDSSTPAPPAPVGGTGGGRVGVPGPADSGTAADASSPVDASLPPGCVTIGDDTNRAAVSQGGVDRGFTARSAFATYRAAPCDSSERELLLVLSEAEGCGTQARRVVLTIDEAEVGAGLIPIGAPLQLAFATALTLRYIEPDVSATDGVWGNCTEAADGSLTFERLDVGVPGGRAAAFFDGTLVDCSEAGGEAPVQIRGAIDVPLELSFEEVCDPS